MGQADALAMMSLHYLQGLGVPQDKVAAGEWQRKAQAAGTAEVAS